MTAFKHKNTANRRGQGVTFSTKSYTDAMNNDLVEW